MSRLKGGQFLIDLTSLGDISTLSVGSHTPQKEFDISNLLPVKTSDELTKLLSKKFIFKVLCWGDTILIELTSTTTLNGSDGYTFSFEVDGAKYYIVIYCGNSIEGSDTNPTINIGRTE